MKRRNFLKSISSTLPMAVLTPTLFNACRQDDSKGKGKSVLIIGAGISGLAAAKKLKAEGYQVTVLEAQEKVGGRLRTDRSLGVAFDEGASWIHGVDGNPITELASKSGATTFHTDDESFLSYDLGGVPYADEVFSGAEAMLYDDVLVNLVNSGAADKSFEQVFLAAYPQFANDRLWRFFLSTYITFDTGDLDKLSSQLYDEGEEYDGEERIMTNGYDTIALYLSQGLHLRLNERVSKVDYSADKVLVTSSGGSFDADFVLVTVPLGVLKNNSILFSPPLPAAKTEAIDRVGMNCVNKFLLTWDNAFWDDEQYIAYTPQERDKFNFFVNVKKFHPTVNALMTFAYADNGRQTEAMSDAEVIDEIMAHLRDIYGSNTPDPTQLLRTKWATNPNAFGAYSFTAVGTEMHHFDDLAQAVSDRLFFAGEHTHIDYFSTAHGAYLSGLREADKIMAI